MKQIFSFELSVLLGGRVVAHDRCTALQNLINEKGEEWKKDKPEMIDEWAEAYEYWCMNE